LGRSTVVGGLYGSSGLWVVNGCEWFRFDVAISRGRDRSASACPTVKPRHPQSTSGSDTDPLSRIERGGRVPPARQARRCSPRRAPGDWTVARWPGIQPCRLKGRLAVGHGHCCGTDRPVLGDAGCSSALRPAACGRAKHVQLPAPGRLSRNAGRFPTT
jgi:hypothetical protein